MGKECLFDLQFVFCTMSSLNKGDVHNCRLYVTIEIVKRVCVQVVKTIRITVGQFDKSPTKRPDIFTA